MLAISQKRKKGGSAASARRKKDLKKKGVENKMTKIRTKEIILGVVVVVVKWDAHHPHNPHL